MADSDDDLPPQVFVVDGADDLDERRRQHFERAHVVIGNVIRRMEALNMNNPLVEQIFRDAHAINEQLELFLVFDRASYARRFLPPYRDAVIELRNNLRRLAFPRGRA